MPSASYVDHEASEAGLTLRQEALDDASASPEIVFGTTDLAFLSFEHDA
ncbi:MAG: hypothetical protein WD737_06835 [Gemmatimonadota bacterium]